MVCIGWVGVAGLLRQTPPVHACAITQEDCCHYPTRSSTYLLEHRLRVGEVGEHGLDIGLVGRPFQEAPKGALRPLHRARWLQQRAATAWEGRAQSRFQNVEMRTFGVLAAPKLVVAVPRQAGGKR
jgi:hypothetical protein